MQKEEIIHQYLQAGFRIFPLNGKHPIKGSGGWQNTKQNPFLDVKKFTKNFGICLQADDLVIDVDVGEREDGSLKKGKESFNELVKTCGLKFKDTYGVKTGSGGFHFYFKKPKDFNIKEKWRAYPDLEFKSKGRYVVGAGSIHPDTHKIYKIVLGEICHVDTAPATLLEIIKYTPIEFKDNGLTKYVDDPQTVARCKSYLKMSNGAVEGRGGDQNTYVIACRCRAFGLSPQVTLDLLLEFWNPKCEPEWDAEELKLKVQNAYAYDSAPQGVKHPESDFKDVPVMKKYHWGSKVRADGTRKANIQNTVVYFDLIDELNELTKFNTFTDEIEFSRIPTWYPPGKTLVPWTDNDATQVRYIMHTKQKYEVYKPDIHDAALIDSHNRPFHPLKDYLNGLEWDKVERVNSWLSKYAGAEDGIYTQTIGSKTLLAAVARVFDPGCKFDTMLVLEGDQGVGKSRLVAALGMDWAGDMHLDPHHKDTVAAMRNKWIIEVSEMEFVRKADINAMKAFLSRKTDRHRLSHRRNAEDYPRQCIFIGTINPDQGGGYLRDPTGNRRFWPIGVGKKIKVEELEKDIDQIWAEAVYRYKHGEKNLHIEDEAVGIIAQLEAEKRRPKDMWIPVIKDWLNKKGEDGNLRMHVSSMEIYTGCLNGVPRLIGRSEQTRITQIMVKELRWKKGSFSRDGKTIAGYSRPKDCVELL